jgi:hypothetical protein
MGFSVSEQADEALSENDEMWSAIYSAWQTANTKRQSVAVRFADVDLTIPPSCSFEDAVRMYLVASGEEEDLEELSKDELLNECIQLACDVANKEKKSVRITLSGVDFTVPPFSSVEKVVETFLRSANQTDVLKFFDASRVVQCEEGFRFLTSQEKYDNLGRELLASLPGVIQSGEAALIKWVGDFSDVHEFLSSGICDKAELAGNLKAAGYVRNAHSKEPNPALNLTMLAEYVVGQAINCLENNRPIHHVAGNFSYKYESLVTFNELIASLPAVVQSGEEATVKWLGEFLRLSQIMDETLYDRTAIAAVLKSAGYRSNDHVNNGDIVTNPSVCAKYIIGQIIAFFEKEGPIEAYNISFFHEQAGHFMALYGELTAKEQGIDGRRWADSLGKRSGREIS